MEKSWDYLVHIARISLERLKYRDEKSLKGKEISISWHGRMF